MTDGKPPDKRRDIVTTSELVIVAAILSFLFALLVPAVNAARDAATAANSGRPPILPFLIPLYSANPWLFLFLFPVVTTALFGGLLLGLRAILPQWVRDRFPWTVPPKPEPIPIEDSRPAIISPVIASSATALLIFAASHVRADRTHRRPVVTWEGPAADYVEYLAYSGWALSAIALIAGIYALERCTSRWNWLGSLAVFLSIVNFFGSLLFWVVVYED